MNENIKKDIGRKGEEYACMYYIKYGYKIKARNFYCKYGEIDVIAVNDTHVVFAEVKTRNSSSALRPSVNVTKEKQKKLIKTAAVFLQKNKLDLQPRFDVIEVLVNSYNLKCVSLNNIENAFIQEGNYAVF